MKKVTLHFQDIRDLRRFMHIVESNYIEMIAKDLTIACTCDDAEIELAERAFNATVVKTETNPS